MDAAPCLEEDESDTPEVPIPAPDRLRETGRGIFPKRGLGFGLPLAACVEEKDPERVCEAEGGGMTNLSTMDRGGERGRDVRSGRLPGEPDMLSRC